MSQFFLTLLSTLFMMHKLIMHKLMMDKHSLGMGTQNLVISAQKPLNNLELSCGALLAIHGLAKGVRARNACGIPRDMLTGDTTA